MLCESHECSAAELWAWGHGRSHSAMGSRKIHLGGGGLLEPLFHTPPLEGAPRAGSLFSTSFVHISNLHNPQVKGPNATRARHQRQAFSLKSLTESQRSGKTFRHFRRPEQGVVPCEHALPPPALEVVGGKISGICIEEIRLWPLEPLSATPRPNLRGLQGPPFPPQVKFPPAMGPSPESRSLGKTEKGKEGAVLLSDALC